MLNSDAVTLAVAVQSFTNGSFTMDRRKYVSRLPYAGDLNSVALENIYTGIKINFGELAATNFVKMVNNLQNLSARSFGLALREFWETGCSITKATEYNIGDVEMLEGHEAGYDFGSQFNVVMNRSQSEEDLIRVASLSIKKPFVLNHLYEIGEDPREDFDGEWF